MAWSPLKVQLCKLGGMAVQFCIGLAIKQFYILGSKGPIVPTRWGRGKMLSNVGSGSPIMLLADLILDLGTSCTCLCSLHTMQ